MREEDIYFAPKLNQKHLDPKIHSTNLTTAKNLNSKTHMLRIIVALEAIFKNWGSGFAHKIANLSHIHVERAASWPELKLTN